MAAWMPAPSWAMRRAFDLFTSATYAVMSVLAICAARIGDGSFTVTATSSVLVPATAETSFCNLSSVVFRCSVEMTWLSSVGWVSSVAAVAVASPALAVPAPTAWPGPAMTSTFPVAA